MRGSARWTTASATPTLGVSQARRSVVAARALAPLACLALTVAGCGSTGSGEAPPAAGAPLKIGYLASLTGFCSTFSQEYVEGARLAVKEVNEHGGVLGHKLELIVRDDKATPTVGVSRARDLVLSDHVKYLAGTCSSAVGKSVEQLVANPSHVIYAVGVSDPTVFAGGPSIYAFDTIPTAKVEGENAAAYARAHPRWKRIAVISEDYSYGYQVTAAFKRAMAGSGQTIVSQDYVPSGGSDYTPYIDKLLAEHPDAIYSTVITEDTVTLVKEGLPLGLFDGGNRFFGIMDYATIDAMPKPPVGVAGYTFYPSSSIYHTPFAHDLQALGGQVANGGAAGDAFNQIQLIAQGIAKAGSTDPTKVREALAGAKVQTVQGSVEIHKCNHEVAMPIAMGTVVGPTSKVAFAHFQPLTLVSTDKYFEC